MSLNLEIHGVRQIVVTKTGKEDTQRISYDTWQTPSKVTKEIIASGDPVKAYCAWLLGEGWMFDASFAKREVASVKAWAKDALDDGYELIFMGV